MNLAPLNHAAVRACLLRRQSLPTLPLTFNKLVSVASDPNSNILELVEIIAYDPSLMANVLRIANSSYLGHTERIQDLSEAVLFLGVGEVRRIALSIGAFDIFGTRGVSSTFLSAIWLHSVTTALISQQIAKQAQFDFADEIYVAGLLHDLGKMFFAIFYPAVYAPLRAEIVNRKGDALALESQIFGMTHLESAQELCQHWNLSATVMAVAKNHHQPMEAPEETRLITLCVAASNVFAHHILADEPVDTRLPLAYLWLQELAANSSNPSVFNPEQIQAILMSEAERARRIEESSSVSRKTPSVIIERKR